MASDRCCCCAHPERVRNITLSGAPFSTLELIQSMPIPFSSISYSTVMCVYDCVVSHIVRAGAAANPAVLAARDDAQAQAHAWQLHAASHHRRCLDGPRSILPR